MSPNRFIPKILLSLSLMCLFFFRSSGQKAVEINDRLPHHVLRYGQIAYYEDESGQLSFDAIRSASMSSRFKENVISTPRIRNPNSVYWYKIKIKFKPESAEDWVLEFFDQTLDEIHVYAPGQGGKYTETKFGASFPFRDRFYQHKNFLYKLDNSKAREQVFYIGIKSAQAGSTLIILRHMRWFVQYSIQEYLLFGLFYGMIAVFALYNLLMFFAIKRVQYLYYVLYNVSIGLYEMCIDGIAFQYLWPEFPGWNRYAYGPMLYLSSIFGLLFAINFLYIKSKAPRLYRLILAVIVLRTLFFVTCIYHPHLFTYKLIEVIPLGIALGCGIYVWKQGYKPGRFFVAGYSFLFLGLLVKVLVLLNVSWLPYGPITHYSLSFCFVIEMVLVSFAIGDNIRALRKKKERAQKRIINQLQINEALKDQLNKELTSLVDERTKEVRDKAAIIEKQNEEISLMNVMLEKDNQELHKNIEQVTRARVMSKEVDFVEFSKVYPDRETCFKYLSDLKWTNGYACRKCGNTHYLAGFLPFSRRCTKCGYDESVIAYTLFQNSRIPINKAFYMLFLVYSTKGKISSYKLSQLLLIRQSTCWAYNSKMQKVYEERKSEVKNAGEGGWSKLILE